MKKPKYIKLSIYLTACIIALASFAGGQNSPALQGRIFDERGAVVVGATIVLEDDKGGKITAVTDGDGQYVLSSLSPGTYTLTISAKGFSESSQTVELTNSSTIDVTLKITVTERIDVQARSDNLTAAALTGAQLDALPSDPRQLRLRLQRLAGAAGGSDDFVVYVDGFREEGALPPKEAISAILINAEPFAAEFAEPGKARVEILTKPAISRLHGGLNFYFSDESLNARHPFALHKATFQSRHFSGVLSTPIERERWGFFADFSRNELDDNAIVNALVLNPNTFQPMRFNTTVLTPVKGANFSLRTSRLFGKKHTFDARYLFSRESAAGQGLESSFDLPERAYNRAWRSNTLRFSLVSTLSEKSLNEARLSLSRNRSLINTPNSDVAVIVFDSFNAGGNQDLLFLDETTENLRLENNFTRIFQNHVLKLGASIGAVKIENIDRSNFGGTFMFGVDLARGPTGLPQGFYVSPLESYRYTLERRAGYRPLQFVVNQGDPFVDLTQWETGVFAQDNWQISKRVTLSLGLRSEFQTNLDDKINLAPRAAIAVRPFEKLESVLRASAGLFYSRVAPHISIDALRFDGRRQEELVVVRPPFFPDVPPVLNGAIAQTTLRPKASDLRSPYLFVSTVSFEQPLSKNLRSVFTYNFERGVHLLRIRNINAPLPNTNNERPNPDVGPILQYESSGISRRQEFVTALFGDLSDKFSFFGSYRLGFAKSDTDGTRQAPADSYNLASEYGYTKFDRRHQFYFETYARLPFGIYFSPNVFVATGTPFNITTGRDDNGDTLFTDRPAFANPGDAGAIITPFGTFNPNPQPGDPIIPRNFGRGASLVSVNLNTSKTFVFGTEKGSQGAQANQGNCTAGFFRRFRCGLNRSYGLTLSAEVYNVLNHTNFSEYNNIVTSPLFGRPNRAGDARRVQLGVSLSF
jgi:hypothetical protein